MPDEQTNDLPQTTTEAIEAEEAIKGEADDIRERHYPKGEGQPSWDPMDRDLFVKLLPLLRRPIPPAFIRHVPKIDGKPYPSTGVSSVQVQMNRMDNVLTPLGWWYEDEYEQAGKLCTVTIFVGDAGSQNRLLGPELTDMGAGTRRRLDGPRFLLARSSKGGVERGTGLGNIHKGSFTNAAKLALARVGPGWEIYLGGTDLDPDVSGDIAGVKPGAGDPGRIGKAAAKKLVDHAWMAGVTPERLRIAASRLAGHRLGEGSDAEAMKTKAKATDALTGALTVEQAEQLDGWFSAEADAAAAKLDA